MSRERASHVAAIPDALSAMEGDEALALGFDLLNELYDEVLRLRERACRAELDRAVEVFTPSAVSDFIQARVRREADGARFGAEPARAVARVIVALEGEGAGPEDAANNAAAMIRAGAGGGPCAVVLVPTVRAAALDLILAKRAARRGLGGSDRRPEGATDRRDEAPSGARAEAMEPETREEPTSIISELRWRKLVDPRGAAVEVAEVEGVGKFRITSDDGAATMALFPDDGSDLIHWREAGGPAALKRAAADHLRASPGG